MTDIDKYLNDKYDLGINISPLTENLKRILPLYITSNYNIILATYNEIQFCLLELVTEQNFTPDQLFKQSGLIKEKADLIPVFTFKQVSSYNIDRYIKKRINFIIPEKILYLPDFLIDIRKQNKSKKGRRKDLVIPMAQLVLLYHLQVESLNNMTTKIVAEKLKLPYISINRAINNLNDFGFCNLSDSKERIIIFEEDKKKLWESAFEYLQSPIEKVFKTDKEYIGKYYRSGINALSHYTFINDEFIEYYAVPKDNLKLIRKDLDEDFGDNMVEVWKYDPAILSSGEFVDKLSLYLTLRNSDDERIEIELKQMISNIEW